MSRHLLSVFMHYCLDDIANVNVQAHIVEVSAVQLHN